MRGPGVSAGIFIESPVLSIDVAPTLTQLGTGTVPDDMDGRSFLPLLKGATADGTVSWRDDFLVTYYGQGRAPCGLQVCPPPRASHFHENDAFNNTYMCIRSLSAREDSMYCEFADDENFVEFYNHTTDAWQLDNCAVKTPVPGVEHYKARLEYLKTCTGVACRA